MPPRTGSGSGASSAGIVSVVVDDQATVGSVTSEPDAPLMARGSGRVASSRPPSLTLDTCARRPVVPPTPGTRARFGRAWDGAGEHLLRDCLTEITTWCDRFSERARHYRRRHLQFTIATLIISGVLTGLSAFPGVSLMVGGAQNPAVNAVIAWLTCALSAALGVIQACIKFMDPVGSEVRCQNAAQRCHRESSRVLAELGMPPNERRLPSDCFVGILDTMEAVFSSDAARLLHGPPLSHPALAWAGSLG